VSGAGAATRAVTLCCAFVTDTNFELMAALERIHDAMGAEVTEASRRLAVILRRHYAVVLPGDRKCFECQRRWPCPTWLMASGLYDD